MNSSSLPYALLPLFTATSAIWWISATPNKPEAYLRLIIVWRSFLIVLSRYRDNRSAPVPPSDLRMTIIECWLVVSATITLDFLLPLDRRSVFTSTPTPLIIIDFCTLPIVALLTCVISAVSLKCTLNNWTRFIRSSGNTRTSGCPSQDNEAQKPLISSCFTESLDEPCFGLCDRVEGTKDSQDDEKEGFCTSVTKFLDASDEKAGLQRISIDDTPTPLQVFIKVEVCREEL